MTYEIFSYSRLSGDNSKFNETFKKLLQEVPGYADEDLAPAVTKLTKCLTNDLDVANILGN